MTYLKYWNNQINNSEIKSDKPEIEWDFSIHPLYLKEKQLKKINLRMNMPVSSLYYINKEDINIETYFTIEYILQEVNKIISEDTDSKINTNTNTNTNIEDISIQEATNIILTKLKTSKNVWDVLLYHKVALAESKARNYSLKKDSITDPLTKLYNRRIVDTKLDELINEYNRSGSKFSLFILDIDFFKKVNDTFWHDMWDEVLIWISEILKKSLRNNDIVARWWWEEFIVILKWTNHEIALRKAESIRENIEKKLIHYIMNNDNLEKFCRHKNWCKHKNECRNKKLMCFPQKITCSIWVSTITEQSWETETKNHIIKRADSALYNAKEKWRNIVCSWKWLVISKKED